MTRTRFQRSNAASARDYDELSVPNLEAIAAGAPAAPMATGAQSGKGSAPVVISIIAILIGL